MQVQRRLLVIATLSAALGVALMWFYVRRFEREVSGGQPIGVLFALRDIPMGEALSADALGIKKVPEAYLERRFVRASEAQRLVGVRVSSGVEAGEAIFWSDLAAAGAEHRDLSKLVPRNHRAISLPADASSSFGGLVRPGDRVDVLLSAERQGEEVTVPLLQNIMVLALGTDLGADPGGPAGAPRQSASSAVAAAHQVTLSVSVAQAQTLAHAKAQGRLTMVLRNPADITVTDNLPEVTAGDLLQNQHREALLHRGARPTSDKASIERVQ